MERVCPKCGTLVSGEGSFCPECGASLGSVVDLNKPSEPVQPVPTPIPGSGYTQNNAQPVNYQNPAYYNNMPAAEPYERMSVGSWVGTVILTSWFGVISIILLFVWAFGSGTPQPKKNYCRAMLIFELIAFIGVLVCIIIFFCVFGWNIEAIANFFEEFERNVEHSFNI